MLREIWSHTRPTFKRLKFTPGLNIVLVRRSESAGQGAKRNAAGKSSLIDIIHFIFGGNKESTSPLAAAELATDGFKLTFDLHSELLEVTRSLDKSSSVLLDGTIRNWPVAPDVDEKTGTISMTIAKWCDLLGQSMFGLPPASQLQDGSFLSFRSCFAYFARRQRSDAYFNWRRHFAQQKPVAWQTTLAFLFGLDRDIPVELHRIKETEKQKGQLEKLLRSEMIASAIPSPSKLQTEVRKLKRQIDRLNTQLDGYRVIEFYDDLVGEANSLQREIADLVNANALDDELLKDIELAMAQETPPAIPELEQLYREAGVVLPNITLKRYSDVKDFHLAVVRNRREHLSSERADVRIRIERRKKSISELGQRRNEILRILESGGALQHYRKLDGQLSDLQSRYNTLVRQLELAEKISLFRSDLKVQRAEVERRQKQDLIERRKQLDGISTIFEGISASLYEKPSYLEIRSNKDGLDFHIDSPEIASDGISKVQIFTFDITLAIYCAQRKAWPGFLIHDSHIFDGVDGRQIAAALAVAHEHMTKVQGQYIVTMNSDDLEKAERESGLSFQERIVHPELDDTENGCLFGFRFATDEIQPEESQPD